jgi:YjbE family integral membrane protein
VETLEILSPEFWTALLSIIVIDLVLAGDNAIVIGMAARNLPKKDQSKVIFWGTMGAVGIRVLATAIVVYLLKIPGLLLLGGLLLVWMAYKLLVEDKGSEEVAPSESFWAAIQTIIIADAVMGIDNVLAVAGASHGSFLMIVLGLLISVPIVVWGSTIVIRFIERFPIIIYIGSGVIAYTGATMIMDEPLIKPYFEGNTLLYWSVVILVVSGVLAASQYKVRGEDRYKLH